MAKKIKIYFDDWREFINIQERRNRNKTTKTLRELTKGDVIEVPWEHYNSDGTTYVTINKFMLLEPVKVESIHSKLNPPKALCKLSVVDLTDITKGISPEEEYQVYKDMKIYHVLEGYKAFDISNKDLTIEEVYDDITVNVLDHRVFSTLPVKEEEK